MRCSDPSTTLRFAQGPINLLFSHPSKRIFDFPKATPNLPRLPKGKLQENLNGSVAQLVRVRA
jgi:hypothetical protein